MTNVFNWPGAASCSAQRFVSEVPTGDLQTTALLPAVIAPSHGILALIGVGFLYRYLSKTGKSVKVFYSRELGTFVTL